MLRCIACDRAMSDMTRDLCSKCESIAMSLIPKSLIKGTVTCNSDQLISEMCSLISPSIATQLSPSILQLDTSGVLSVIDQLKHMASSYGAQLPVGVCIATDATLPGV